jgi:RNA polymerase sigma factor FliA
MTTAEQHQLATRFLPRIRKIARGICRQLPAHVEADDLAQAGVIGMLSALRSYDPARGDCVEIYVTRRVRGAILDELRALDPLSRDQRRDARAVSGVAHALEGELGRTPLEEELAARAGVPVERIRALRVLAHATARVPLDDPCVERASTHEGDPTERLTIEKLTARLAGALAELTAREQTVLQLYYVEELSLKEIGGLLGVTESRVCQIHGAAVKRLRAQLGPSA